MGADGNYPRQPPERRRLVRTQIEELFALYRLYPLPEFESVGRPTVTRSRITIRCLQRLSSETRMHEQWRFGRKSKRGQVNVEGSAAWLPSPISPPRNSGDTKPSTVAGSGPNTGNPAGGADGVWLGSVGGIAAKTRDRQRGSGACCPTRD